jgi:glutaredoxin
MTRSTARPWVVILSKPGCELCDDAKAVLQALQAIEPFTLQEIICADDPELMDRYGEDIPVVFIHGRKAFKYRVDAAQCLRRLRRQPRM